MELEQSKKRGHTNTLNCIWHAIPDVYARAVFRNLCEHRNSITRLCFPNEIDIAREELMSVWKVNKCIKLLVSLKIITIKKQWKSNGYIIHDKDISYLSHVCGTCDDDDKSDLSHVPHTLDTPLSHVPHTLDHMCHTHTNNMNSKKINKKNNKMNILVPLHGTCVLSEDKILNLNTDEWIESKNINIGSGLILKDDKSGSDVIQDGSGLILNNSILDQTRSNIGSGVMHTIEYKQKNINITLEYHTQEYSPEAGACVYDDEVIILNPKDQMKEIKIYEAEEICKEQDRLATDDEILRLFNEMLGEDLRKIKYITGERKVKVQKRIKDLPIISEWIELFGKIQQSDFLCGRTDKWRATFDWIIKESNLVKILEDNYENREVTTNAANRRPKSRYENQIEQSAKLEQYFTDAVTEEREARISKE